MKRMLPTALLAVTGLLLLAGCTNAQAGVSPGTYQAPGDRFPSPTLVLDLQDRRFTLSCDPLSSYLPTGSVTLTGDRMTCTTDDGQCTYVFDVPDRESLVFQAGLSQPMTGQEDTLLDGTRFYFVGPR